MSWRILILILAIFLGLSAWGGMKLGDQLVANAPIAEAPPNQSGLGTDEPVLDADGKAYTAQPPQPRVDGTLGVPPTADTIRTADADSAPLKSLFDAPTEASILISRDPLTKDELARIMNLEADSAGVQQQFVLVPPPGQGNQLPALQPIELPASEQAAAATAATAGNDAQSGNWQQALRAELARCAETGFFERPTCAWNARNHYCEPNNGWGTIAECPRRNRF
ncbi:hypothetical protein FMZ60_12695 [Alcaligenaceae bacterium SJ-26]|nr:hypothetical protein FMZ60_12695 [Alcaligenaceae bacterium SJ-26]